MGFFDGVFSNFMTTIRTVGSSINKYLPAALFGIKSVAKWVQNNGVLDAITKPAGIIHDLGDAALRFHRYLDPNHEFYKDRDEPFVPNVNEPESVDTQPTV